MQSIVAERKWTEPVRAEQPTPPVDWAQRLNLPVTGGWRDEAEIALGAGSLNEGAAGSSHDGESVRVLRR